MILTELTEGLAGRAQKGRHDRALQDVVTPLVNEIIQRRRADYEASGMPALRSARKEFFRGYPTVERYLRALWEQEDFDREIEPLLDELKKAAFAAYTRYVDTLDQG